MYIDNSACSKVLVQWAFWMSSYLLISKFSIRGLSSHYVLCSILSKSFTHFLDSHPPASTLSRVGGFGTN